MIIVKSLDLKLISQSENADYVILNNIEEEGKFSSKKYSDAHVKEDKLKDNQYFKKHFGVFKKVGNNKDIEEIKTISEKGADFVIIDVDDWKIIPLENIIAILQKTNTEIFAIAKSVQEVETLFTVLELGVDGVIIETDNEEDILKIKSIIREIVFNIEPAKILEIKDIGIGERVCIDTVSMLSEGEGMLIGNKSNFLFGT